MRRAVPVIPGPKPPTGPCDACGSRTERVTRAVAEGIEMVLCEDAAACSRRYRAGLPPSTYAMGLRGELLAVAP